ncbi:MAG: type I polyketide synthase [Cytophagales bacterium]|nr:type I polyketide synthase [Cytophagales bacterium]
MPNYNGLEVAIIGMSGQFPESRDLQEFWTNLCTSKELIKSFSEDELLALGMSIEDINQPGFIGSQGSFDHPENFDYQFFGYTRHEADLMDPQIRLLHEHTWKAIEDSGEKISSDSKTGLYLAASDNLNWRTYAELSPNSNVDPFFLSEISNKNFASTLIAYKLNLKGPCYYLDTACSSSLVATHLACRALLMKECDIAVSGGVSISSTVSKGYSYVPGAKDSSDGHCRSFDKDSSGTVSGEGVGVVVLKRLQEAIEDGDHIYAVIKSTAVNNDGNRKVGYTAPSILGQYECIKNAQQIGKVPYDTISYVEAHGTGTKLGDPVEVAALNKAFNHDTSHSCTLGSVKSNLGHLDAAAGVAGFIKVALMLKNKTIPPTLHFNEANPDIEFESGPFKVTSELKNWSENKTPLRAGVSSFGIGGTNSHLILEEAPIQKSIASSRSHYTLTVSGNSVAALNQNIENLSVWLGQHSDTELADISHTLTSRRKSFPYRKSVVCQSIGEAVEKLEALKKEPPSTPLTKNKQNHIVFMFPGQGSQHRNMCVQLYEQEAYFRKEVDQCFDHLKSLTKKDLRSVVFSDTETPINELEYAIPLNFIFEYALAKLLINWGIKPKSMIGHSVGEYVAACIGGVFKFKDALWLVLKRAELMQSMPTGAMLSISISEKNLTPYLSNTDKLSLAAVNSTQSCVVSGPVEVIDQFRTKMEENGFSTKLIKTSHAAHSFMMDGVLTDFENAFDQIEISAQQIPIISNLTGKSALDVEISQPGYWTSHLRQTVRFCDGIDTLLNQKNALFLEVGPGKTLSSFVGGNSNKTNNQPIINFLGHPKDTASDLEHVLSGVSKLWTLGLEPDWDKISESEKRAVIPLPTYAFDQLKCVSNVDVRNILYRRLGSGTERIKMDDWFYRPTWKLVPKPHGQEDLLNCSLVFLDKEDIGVLIVEQLKNEGKQVIVVKEGDEFIQHDDSLSFILNPNNEKDFTRLFDSILTRKLSPQRIIYCWGLLSKEPQEEPLPFTVNQTCIPGLLNFIKTLPAEMTSISEVTAIVNELHDIESTNPQISGPAKSLIVPMLKVIGQEFPGIKTGLVDISTNQPEEDDRLYAEVIHAEPGKVIALRNGLRFKQIFDPIKVHQEEVTAFRHEGVYLITGGLGDFGYRVAQFLGETYHAKLILLGKSKLPDRSLWEGMIEDGSTSDSFKEKLVKMMALEKLENQPVYFACDISSQTEFNDILKESEKIFGKPNGVIHAAGIVGGSTFKPLRDLSEDDFNRQFAPKISGLISLKESLKDYDLDFCILTSSISSILGGLGFAAYAAANTFLDYFVASNRSQGKLRSWISVNFDSLERESLHKKEISGLLQKLISLKDNPQVVVSYTNLGLQMDKWVDKATDDEDDLSLDAGFEDQTMSYLDHLTDEEKSVLAIWRSFFGRKDITLDTDFFEIGGDSLKAVHIANKISKLINVNVGPTDILVNPSVSKLTTLIESRQNSENADDKVDDTYELII